MKGFFQIKKIDNISTVKIRKIVKRMKKKGNVLADVRIVYFPKMILNS
jgi:hypothetical protein